MLCEPQKDGYCGYLDTIAGIGVINIDESLFLPFTRVQAAY